MADAGAILHTVECAFGDRDFEVTEAGNPLHTQLRTWDELWIKENLMNIGIRRMGPECQYILCADSDLAWCDPDWASEIVQALQHYYVIQAFTQSIDFGPTHEVVDHSVGMVYDLSRETSYYPSENDWYDRNAKEKEVRIWQGHDEHRKHKHPHKPHGHHHECNCPQCCDWEYFCRTRGDKTVRHNHPGYAWAYRREALDMLGGLIEFPILGSADRHMAYALYGRVLETINPKMHPNYKKWALIWQDRAEYYIRRDIGYLKSTVFHHHHGNKRDRQYHNRHQILVDCQFDPERHIDYDSNGVLQLTYHAPIGLRDGIRDYFDSRAEDDIRPFK